MSNDERVAEILADWYERREQGETSDPGDVLAVHPELAAELSAQFAAQAMFDRIAGRAPSAAPAVSAALGEFRIVREIGRGGMGVVYEAEQTAMHRHVALKVLHPSVTSSRRAVERFQREARAAGQLHHTNVVPVYSMGEEHGVWFYAMELVSGLPLDQVIDNVRRFAQAPAGGIGSAIGFSTHPGSRAHFERVALAFAGVAEGLEAAHAAGIVHRDVKPSNLVLDPAGTLRLMDFGLARVADDATATRTGELLGTPSYMSPEQVEGRVAAIGARTDVYALGATLYEVLALRAPFEGDSVPAILAQIRNAEPPSLRRLDARIPRDLETIVQKSMEKDPARRFASADEMAHDLRRFAEGGTIRARRIGAVGRAWRLVKRHRALSAVAGAAIALAVLAGVLALDAMHEAAARRGLRYARLCTAAGEMVVRGRALAGPNRIAFDAPPDLVNVRELIAEAIGLDPSRPDAFFCRAICSGTALDKALADLDAAHRRGLGERAWQLGRAAVFHRHRRTAECDSAEAAALALASSDSPRDSYLRGWLLLVRGRRREAIDAFTASLRGAQAGGFRVQAHFLRAMAREKAGDLGGAIEDLEAVRESGDSRPPVCVSIASLWRRSKDEGRAKSALSDSLNEVRERGDAEAWREICAACRRCGERDWADAITREAIAAMPGEPRLLVERVQALWGLRRHPEALVVIEQARALAPLDHRVLRIRGWGLLYAGKPHDAIPAFDESLLASSGCWDCLSGRAQALEAAGKMEEAQVAYAAVCVASPGEAVPHTNFGSFLANRRGDWAAAEVEFRAAIDIEPDYREAHYNLANALVHRGDIDGAVAEYRDVIGLDPAWPPAHNNLGSVLVNRGDADAAIVELREAIRLKPDYALAHANLGEALEKKDEADAAIASYLEAIRLGHRDADVYVNLGLLLQRKGDVEGAIQAGQDAIKVDANHPGAHCEHGLGLWYAGRMDEALVETERAIELGPRSSWFRVNRWQILTAIGRHVEALSACEHDDTELSGKMVFALERVISLFFLGHTEEARAFAAASLSRAPGHGDELEFAYICTFADRPEEAQAWLAKGESLDGADDAFKRARVFAALGDRESALRWVETAAEKGHREAAQRPSEPAFDFVKDDPRFVTSMARMVIR